MLKTKLFALALMTIPICAHAEISLGSPFTNNAVLQRNSEVPIWGWAKPGATIVASTSWGAQARGKAGTDGKFLMKLKTPSAGGPFNIMFTGDGKAAITNILSGDVWVCSGQSNMEMTVHKSYPPPLLNQDTEIKTANYPMIRLFHVGKSMQESPAARCGGKWEICSPETVGGFSACGYFFGRELFRNVGVPIGLIDSTWGGTEVELWTSETGMKRIPDFAKRINESEEAKKKYLAEAAAWGAKVGALDPGTDTWSNVVCDETGFKPCPPTPTFDQIELSNFDGIVWVRANFELEEEATEEDWTLELGAIDDEDLTFVNGHLVGSTSDWQKRRSYKVPRSMLLQGTNVIAIRILDISGPGGFATPGQAALVSGEEKIPLGKWRARASTELAKLPPRPQFQGARYSLLYNGMIAPLVPYKIKGAIWYQGEANVDRAYQYRTSFPNMIRDWRSNWNSGDFPFYFVQIAPFTYGNGMSPELREAQLMSLSVPKTGMVVTTDITDDVRDIHPINKQEVGRRLALWALANDYGRKTIEFSGPLYDRCHVEGSAIRVKFIHANGLNFRGANESGFEIAGTDQKFHPANVWIEGTDLMVRSPEVPKPVAVRYCWSDSAIGYLQNREGLPASPFRTDQWPGKTEKNKW